MRHKQRVVQVGEGSSREWKKPYRGVDEPVVHRAVRRRAKDNSSNEMIGNQTASEAVSRFGVHIPKLCIPYRGEHDTNKTGM